MAVYLLSLVVRLRIDMRGEVCEFVLNEWMEKLGLVNQGFDSFLSKHRL